MIIWYTARNTFDQDYQDGTAWTKYKKLNNLEHLRELVTLDSILGEPTFEPDFNKEETFRIGVSTDNMFFTYCYTDLDYVLAHVDQIARFNLLAVSLNPDADAKGFELKDFEFLGYDLIDQDNNISAVTNCGGFEETFTGTDLNEFGLIDDYKKAFDIRDRLFINNPEEHHADTNVWAIWRHKKTGRG